MVFIVLFFAIATSCLIVAPKLSPLTERLMRYIWEDPTDKAKVKIARRVKELCIDGGMTNEAAALMIAKENNIMEEQVRELMQASAADPVIMRMAFGSKAGAAVFRALKHFGGMGGMK